jgi:molybdopterin-guanine dinucleotide biosynthesis protein A
MNSLPPVYGLVLAGGFSRRMGQDKARLRYHGKPQALWTAHLLQDVCERVFYSCRAEQDLGEADTGEFRRIPDVAEGKGPLAGMVGAFRRFPCAAWLIVACDLPNLSPSLVEFLVERRTPGHGVTAFRSASDGLPEPLCALYEPGFAPMLEAALADDRRCPRKLLIERGGRVALHALPDPRALDNFNTPEDLKTAKFGIR